MKSPIAVLMFVSVELAVLLPVAHCQVDQNGNRISPTPTPYEVNSVSRKSTATKDVSEQVLDYERLFSERAKEYQEFLGKETDRHQSFLAEIFSVLAWILGGLAAIFAAILTFFQYKTKNEIRTQITSNFQATVSSLIEARMIEFEQHVGAKKKQVEERTQAFENEIDQIRVKFEQLKFDTNREFDTIAEYASVLGHAAVVIGLDEKDDPDELRKKTREEVQKRLVDLQKKIPTHRTLAIFIGRLLRQMKQLEKAVEVLDLTLEARSKDTELANNEDQAALLYNKACYLNLIARNEGIELKRKPLLEQAWTAVRESVRLDRANLEFAKLDPDLKGLEAPPEREWASL